MTHISWVGCVLENWKGIGEPLGATRDFRGDFSVSFGISVGIGIEDVLVFKLKSYWKGIGE